MRKREKNSESTHKHLLGKQFQGRNPTQAEFHMVNDEHDHSPLSESQHLHTFAAAQSVLENPLDTVSQRRDN